MPLVIKQLNLTDSADTTEAVKWADGAGGYIVITEGRLVVRASEDEDDATPPLVDVAAVLSDGATLATAVIPKAAIVAADFEGLVDRQGVWEFVLTRADGYTLSAMGGAAVWSRGVARP